METAPDPADRRRTIVRPTARIPERVAQQGSLPVDGLLGEALGLQDEQAVGEVVAGLETLLQQLRATRRGRADG